jgi:hypothetical protein
MLKIEVAVSQKEIMHSVVSEVLTTLGMRRAIVCYMTPWSLAEVLEECTTSISELLASCWLFAWLTF